MSLCGVGLPKKVLSCGSEFRARVKRISITKSKSSVSSRFHGETTHEGCKEMHWPRVHYHLYRLLDGTLTAHEIVPLTRDEKIQRAPRAGRGVLARYRKTTGRNAERWLSLAESFDAISSVDRTSFFTMSCPGRSKRAVRAWAMYASATKEAFLAWVRRRTKGSAIYLFKWEQHRDGALHWHSVVDFGNWFNAELAVFEFRSWCLSWLDRLSEMVGFPISERRDYQPRRVPIEECYKCDAQMVKRSASRYVAKYIAKAAKKGKKRFNYCPPSWLSCSRKLTEKLRETQFSVEKGCDRKCEANVLTRLSDVVMNLFCDRNNRIMHKDGGHVATSHCDDDGYMVDFGMSVVNRLFNSDWLNKYFLNPEITGGADSDFYIWEKVRFRLGIDADFIDFSLENMRNPTEFLIKKIQSLRRAAEGGDISKVTLYCRHLPGWVDCLA